MYSINKIENITSRYNSTKKLVYSVEPTTTNIIKHELSTDNGKTYKEITPILVDNHYQYNIDVDKNVKTCYVRLTDSEGTSATSNVFTAKSEGLANSLPTITDMNITSSKDTYTLKYKATDSNGDTLTHYISLNNSEYSVITPTNSNNLFTYNGNGLVKGTNIIKLKLSDGYDEVEKIVSVFREIANKPPTLSNVRVSISGINYKLIYTVNNESKDKIKHYLNIDNKGYEPITPVNMGNENYMFTGQLTEGNHKLIVKVIDDHNNEVISNELNANVINVISQVKAELVTAKDDYITSYDNLKKTVADITNDMIFDKDTEQTLLDNALSDYRTKFSKFSEVSNKAMDSIATDKTDTIKNELNKEFNELTNALGSLDNTINDVFKDSILSESEKIVIKQQLQNLTLEKADVDSKYNSVKSNYKQSDLSKEWYKKTYDTLIAKYDYYNEQFRNLNLVITHLLDKEGILDNSDLVSKDKAIADYGLALSEIGKAITNSIDAIAKNESENNATNLEEYYSEFLLEKDRINLEVGKKLGADKVISAINMSPESIKIKSNKINLDGYVTITSLANGTTNIDGDCIMTGTVECSKLTASNTRPYIELFNNNSTEMALDATKNDLFGVGDSIRLKRDRYNYVYVGNKEIRFYLGDNNSDSDYGNVFKVNNNGVYYKGNNIANTSLPSHNHDEIRSSSTVVRAGTNGSNNGTSWKAFVPVWGGTPLGHAGSRSNKWSVVVADKSTISTSDRKMKENISYIDSPNLYTLEMTEERLDNGSIYDIKPYITSDDLYTFVRDDLHLATYNYIDNQVYGEGQERDVTMLDADYQLGFIAQDIENTKVGKYITFGVDTVMDNETTPLGTEPRTERMLYVVQNNYINTLAGALQKTIDKVEKLEKALIDNNIPIPQ